MVEYKVKQLKNLVNNGCAIDISNMSVRREVMGNYTQIGYCRNRYGINGKLYCNTEGKMFAVLRPSNALYYYG